MMIEHITHAMPWAVGLIATTIGTMGAMGGDISIWLQAGMAGVVILLLLKFFPMLLKHLEEKDQRHRETVEKIVENNRQKDDKWQEMFEKRGTCPYRDNQDGG